MTSKNKNAPQGRKAYLNAGHACHEHHEQVSDATVANDEIVRNRPNGIDDRIETTLEVNSKTWPFEGKAKAHMSMPVIGIGFLALFAAPWATLYVSAGTISDNWRGTLVLIEIIAIIVMTVLVVYRQRRH
ncbi:hypothetical protein AB0H76_26260 [Nocardia sp. NPDC050712]|uniref:hypothetical protein n=1 Tax=Nocardia sp. NPDC050712 TaxID=3155518 RepID=UPI00340D75D8